MQNNIFRKENKTMEKSTISVQELSAHMGISLAKAYELVKQPGFPVLRIGTRFLIPVDSFNTWLNRKIEGGDKDGDK
jgi:excisionase family DNA binding protein